MGWLMARVGGEHDATLLFLGAGMTGLIALIVAVAARRTLFAPGRTKLEEHAKLYELVHGSLLAFTVFTLALVLTDVRSNLGRTVNSTLREASFITRLDAELEAVGGPQATAARIDLRDYVEAVAGPDWRALSRPGPRLSEQADTALRSLRASVRAVARSSPETASASLLNQLEDLRLGRLESATKSVPDVFWWIIFAFLIGAMVMNGRHSIDAASGTLVGQHMAAIGLVLALILVMDQPFRGETSVSPRPIARALETHPL